MKMNRWFGAIACTVLAGSAWAQTPTPPVDVEGPPSDMATQASAPATGSGAPGVYYGDTSGRRYGGEDRAHDCDDSTYSEPEVHGNVRAGVSTGRHVGSGSYEGATVNVSKRLGSCDDPKGEVRMSISIDNYDQNGGGHRDRHGH